MKTTVLYLLLLACSNYAYSQAKTLQFCAKDTSEHTEKPIANNGFFEVKVDRHGNWFEIDQYKFFIPSDSLNDAFMVVGDVELSDPVNGVYEKIGSFYSDDLHAPTTKKSSLEEGKYTDTWAFKKRIEIWYDGEYIKMVFPKLTNEKSDTHQSFEHTFYIHNDCYEDMLAAFLPMKK